MQHIRGIGGVVVWSAWGDEEDRANLSREDRPGQECSCGQMGKSEKGGGSSIGTKGKSSRDKAEKFDVRKNAGSLSRIEIGGIKVGLERGVPFDGVKLGRDYLIQSSGEKQTKTIGEKWRRRKGNQGQGIE